MYAVERLNAGMTCFHHLKRIRAHRQHGRPHVGHGGVGSNLTIKTDKSTKKEQKTFRWCTPAHKDAIVNGNLRCTTGVCA